jgi:hypothetical protein
MKNGKPPKENIKLSIKEERLNLHIRNLVKAAMIVEEDNISFTDLMLEYSAFLRTKKEGERVLAIDSSFN